LEENAAVYFPHTMRVVRPLTTVQVCGTNAFLVLIKIR